MKITATKQQVKRQDRYSIYIDDKYSFSLSQNDLLVSGLKVGQELSAEEVQNMQSTSALGKSYERALNLISHRPRSEGEIRDYLRRKDLTDHDITTLVNRLEDRGYLDDLDFARRWVATRRLLKATSKRKLTQELRQKKVESNVIDQVLQDDKTDEREVLLELVARKRKQTKYQDQLKLMQYLSRQGFNYGDIKSVLDEQE